MLREATLRDFLHGTVPAEQLAAEVREAVEPLNGNRRRVHIEDLPADEEVTITPEMLVGSAMSFLAGALPGSALEIIAFAAVSRRITCIGVKTTISSAELLYDYWAMTEINSGAYLEQRANVPGLADGSGAAIVGARHDHGHALGPGIPPPYLQGAAVASAGRRMTGMVPYLVGASLALGRWRPVDRRWLRSRPGVLSHDSHRRRVVLCAVRGGGRGRPMRSSSRRSSRLPFLTMCGRRIQALALAGRRRPGRALHPRRVS